MPETLTGLQDALLDWGDAQRRDLPWRRTRDSWAVLVSELMLQQTQVSRVVPKFELFLERFPTPIACAEARTGAVIEAWAGLGYNRRAVNLHRTAVIVRDRHHGRLPEDLDALLALPGIGPYTARAVLTFAHEQDVGVVDTNVGRILARLAGQSLSARQAQARADAVVPPGSGWRWNQAMFDLGATVCTKRSPTCAACPIAAHCVWQLAGGPDPATGSAGVSGAQSTFEGSDRQGRGRLVAALRTGPIRLADVDEHTGWPDDEPRARRVLDTLLADGLAVIDDDSRTIRLP